MKSFLAKLTGITFAIALIGGLVFSLALPQYYIPILPFLLLFFYLTTLGIHSFLLKMSKKGIGTFTRSSMLVTTFKLLLFSVLAVIYIAIDRDNALSFVIYFMLLYIIYSIFEVVEISKITKSKNKQ
ncbi:hypothetical protein [uncultured Draconibacterium sp.]|uniref:hypothetical protein n=1 Tax=uncultured Draconibacterium sp. TaxID=1573823 RepID=UPI0025D91C71|nr:hypothetical protein [uncultured Draconibacterium sp.]